MLTDRWRKLLPEIGIVLVLYGLSFWVRRYAWPFYWFSVFLLRPITTQLAPPGVNARLVSGSVIGAITFILVLLFKMPISFGTMTWDSYCRLALCSPKAAETLVSLYDGEKLLTTYDFGGWLIWNYRSILPAIDGRMHLWKDQKGFAAIAYYWPIEQNLSDINQTDYDLALVSVQKPVSDRLEQLVAEDSWEQWYRDDIAAIYRRVK